MQLLLVRAVIGIFAGGIQPVGMAIVALGTPPERRGLVFGLTTTATSLGNTVGPLPYVYPLQAKTRHTVLRLNHGSQRAMRAPGHPQSCFFTDCAVEPSERTSSDATNRA